MTSLSDHLGVEHSVAREPRILSLVPSLTELIIDLGLADQLVGRTHFCIHPAEIVEKVPSVGGTKKIKWDRVMELRPTHALVNVDENPESMARELKEHGIDVVTTHPMQPADNIELYRLIGGIFGKPTQAKALAEHFELALSHLERRQFPARTAVYLIWAAPWMAVTDDTYIANMLSLVNISVVTPGADPSLTGDAARYPEVRFDDETLSNVDLVLFSSEPFAFDETHIAQFRDAFPAHADKAHLIDGEMTSWYGSRAIPSLRDLGRFAKALNE